MSGADTSVPNPNYGNPSIFLPPTGAPPGDPFIQHAFQWQGGALQDLGSDKISPRLGKPHGSPPAFHTGRAGGEAD